MVSAPEINSLACGAMLACLLPVAVLVEPRRRPMLTLGLLIVEVALGMQMLAPWLHWTPPATWHEAFLHSSMAWVAMALRRGIWAFVRLELGAIEAPHPLRRKEDVAQLMSRVG